VPAGGIIDGTSRFSTAPEDRSVPPLAASLFQQLR